MFYQCIIFRDFQKMVPEDRLFLVESYLILAPNNYWLDSLERSFQISLSSDSFIYFEKSRITALEKY